MKALHAVAAGLLPALCAACGRSCRPGAVACTRCTRRLADAEPLVGNGPQGLDRSWSSASHEGVARDLVTALKFRRLLPVAGLMAERIQWLAPASLLDVDELIAELQEAVLGHGLPYLVKGADRGAAQEIGRAHV